MNPKTFLSGRYFAFSILLGELSTFGPNNSLGRMVHTNKCFASSQNDGGNCEPEQAQNDFILALRASYAVIVGKLLEASISTH